MTDQERLDRALARAAEQVEEGCGCQDCTLHAGWAEAVEALLERPESEHDGGCSAGISKLPCKCSQKFRIEAIRRFCDAMLGAEQSDAHLCPVGGDDHVPVPGICDHD